MKTSTKAKIQFEKDGKKQKHYNIILNALKFPMCAKQIAEKCELTYHQVSRRTGELVSQNRIKIIGQQLTPYSKTSVNIYAKI